MNRQKRKNSHPKEQKNILKMVLFQTFMFFSTLVCPGKTIIDPTDQKPRK
jgi:hypothetical protein